MKENIKSGLEEFMLTGGPANQTSLTQCTGRCLLCRDRASQMDSARL